MTSLKPWLVPTLVGPFATMWSLTTVMFVIGAQMTIFGERLDSWALAMLLTGFVAAGLVVSLLVADVILLAMKLRQRFFWKAAKVSDPFPSATTVEQEPRWDNSFVASETGSGLSLVQMVDHGSPRNTSSQVCGALIATSDAGLRPMRRAY